MKRSLGAGYTIGEKSKTKEAAFKGRFVKDSRKTINVMIKVEWSVRSSLIYVDFVRSGVPLAKKW